MRFLCKKVRVSQLKTGYNFCAPGPAMQHSRAGFSSRIQGKTGTRNETGRFAAKPLPQKPMLPNRVWRFLLDLGGRGGFRAIRAAEKPWHFTAQASGEKVWPGSKNEGAEPSLAISSWPRGRTWRTTGMGHQTHAEACEK